MLDALFSLLGRALRLAPAAALFSLAFVLEGELRWLGLLGLVPLILAYVPGCPACDPAAGRRAPARSEDRAGNPWRPTTPAGYRPWPGH